MAETVRPAVMKLLQNVAALQEHGGRVDLTSFAASDYLLLSTQLAHRFPEMIEAAIVLDNRSPLPTVPVRSNFDYITFSLPSLSSSLPL